MESITFFDEEEQENLEFCVVEETTINQIRYLLVSEDDSEESVAYIMKQTKDSNDEAIFEFVEDDVEYATILKVFSELLEDVDLV